jgi:hypothetical protein
MKTLDGVFRDQSKHFVCKLHENKNSNLWT